MKSIYSTSIHCQVDETDAKMAVANSFTIYGGNRCLVVAAGSQEEKDKWQEDLNTAMAAARGGEGDAGGKMQYASLKSNSECPPRVMGDGSNSSCSELVCSMPASRLIMSAISQNRI